MLRFVAWDRPRQMRLNRHWRTLNCLSEYGHSQIRHASLASFCLETTLGAVGAVYGAVKKIIGENSGGCKTSTGSPNVVYRANKHAKFSDTFGFLFRSQFIHSSYDRPYFVDSSFETETS